MFKNKDLSVTRTFAYIYILVQVVLAFIWMGGNIAVFYPEKLSYDYIEAARTLIVDDYMGILYALFLSPFVIITSNITAIHILVSICQTLMVIGAFWYLTKVLLEEYLSKADRIMLALMAATFPPVLQAEFSILPNAVILSLVVFLYACINAVARKHSIKNGISLILVCVFLSLMPRDYVFITLLILFPALIFEIMNKNYKALLYTGGAVLMLILGACAGNALTEPESYGRIERTIAIHINHRITMPHLAGGVDDIRNYFGEFDYENIKTAINVPEKFFEDYMMAIKESSGGALPDDLLLSLNEKSLLLRKRDIFTSLVKDVMFGCFPIVSVAYIYIRRTTETMMSINILKFIRELPHVSRALWVFFVSGSAVASIMCFIRKKTIGHADRTEIGGKLSICYIVYIVVAVSCYCALFSFYGFDYRDVLFAASVPSVLLFANLLKERDNQ